MSSKEPVEKRRARSADVEITGRRGCETNADVRRHEPQVTQILRNVVVAAVSVAVAFKPGAWQKAPLHIIQERLFRCGGARADPARG
jgi:hypothetical protein